jgi:NADH-quinone oxidoreductase subunit L
MLFGDFFKGAIFVNETKHPAMSEFAGAFHGAGQMAAHALGTLPLWLAIAGVALAYVFYLRKPEWPAAIKRAFMPVFNLLENKYYLDWINENILARGARVLGAGLWKIGDQKIIDGFFVNGSWKLVGWVSGIVRKAQSGYLYHYALVMILGVFVFMSYFVTWPMIVQWLGR